MFGEIPGAQDCICKHSFTINLVSIPMHPVIPHTTQNGQTKQSKMLTLETTIFGLKMLVKSGLEKIILKFHEPLQSRCCPVQKNLLRKAELALSGQQVSLKIKVASILFILFFSQCRDEWCRKVFLWSESNFILTYVTQHHFNGHQSEVVIHPKY